MSAAAIIKKKKRLDLVETTNIFSLFFSLHKKSLLKLIIKCADISNEVRPESVSNKWVSLLFTEYTLQTDCEKREKLPVTPYMDPEKVILLSIDSNHSELSKQLFWVYCAPQACRQSLLRMDVS